MNNSFIKELLKRIPHSNEYFRNTVILFPTKRACVYFKNALIEELGSTNIWLPDIISIQEFLYRHIPIAIADETELLSFLYQIHKKIVPTEEQSFVEFYKWGQMILKDFNEIDQYLIDTRFLFHYVKSLKTIDNSTPLTPEQSALLSQFWNTLPSEENSKIREKFIKTWASLDEIYHSFHAKLSENAKTYEGYAYRMLLQLLETNTKKFHNRNFVIAGFNALSAFEERLFQHLIQHYHTTLYWDADLSYLDNENQESGLFIRRYKKLFPEKVNHIISTSLGTKPKQVSFVEAPLEWVQIKYALQKIAMLDPSETVLVLGDETLLYPLIQNIPESLPYNITMGYPLTIHPIQSLIQQLLHFHQYKKDKKSIPVTTFLKIIKHFLVQQYFDPLKLKKLSDSAYRLGFLNEKIIADAFENRHQLLTLILNVNFTDFDYLQTILHYFLLNETNPKLDKLAIQSTLEVIQKIIQSTKDKDIVFIEGEFHKLLKNEVTSIKLPFNNSETSGLQIMGFLETRNLDFKNVIIVGATDNHLPGTNKSGSFIPFSIRKALNLPTFQENDAIYGYHFYRLLQRAEDISLIYAIDIEKGVVNKSRFIEQIKYEWKQFESNQICFKDIIINIPVPKPKFPDPIIIEKHHPNIQVSIDKYFNGNRQISASSLITYIRCPFQYYLKYIIGLQEPEELMEEYDQRILGLVFHSAMEIFYAPFLKSGEWINANNLSTYLKQIDLNKILASAFEKNELELDERKLVGQNLLIRDVCRHLMGKIIQLDIQSPYEFKIIGLELKIKDIPLMLNPDQKIYLKGTIDRVDLVKINDKQSYTRIIDYKTGKAQINNSNYYKSEKPIEQYMSEYFKNYNLKEGLQGYFYAYLYQKQFLCDNITVGFYTARALNDGLLLLRNGAILGDDLLLEFEHSLKNILAEIFDLNQPFIQTENEKAYEYSPYKVLIE